MGTITGLLSQITSEIRIILPMTLDEIGALIRKRRDYFGISQEALSEMSQLGIRTIHQIETGKGNPSFSTLQKLLNILGLDIVVLIKTT